ncbi:hypothetical protein EV701_12099 [Chthoniobacter flavus]|nr:hypothetical protein EV701_12099 [Chthoniobacter flavus]
MEAIFEARTTGNNKEADRLTALLEAARQAPASASASADSAAAASLDADGAAAAAAAAVDPESISTPGSEPPAGGRAPEEEREPNRLRITHLTDADKSDQIAIHALTKKGVPLAEAVQRILGPLPNALGGQGLSNSQGGPNNAQGLPNGQSAQGGRMALEIPGMNFVQGAASAQSTPSGAQGTSIAALEAEVAELERQLDATTRGGGSLYGSEAARVTKELSRMNARLEAARFAAAVSEREHAREQARELGAFEAQRDANDAAARKQFPALNHENSPLFQLWYELSVAAHSPTHPDHAKAQSVDGPMHFAAKAARMLGAQGAAGRGGGPAMPAVPAAQPPPAIRPAAANKGSAPPPPARTAADIAREAEAAFEAATTGNFRAYRRPIGSIITR